jgi:enterochelin esterase family protein
MQELGENEEFGKFVATELIPWLRDRYNVTREFHDTVVGGQSAGGAAAAYVALRHSDVFGAVLSQSAAFWSSPESARELAERSPATDQSDDRHVLAGC